MRESLSLSLVTPETELIQLGKDDAATTTNNNTTTTTTKTPSLCLPGFPLVSLGDSLAVNQRLSADLSTARLGRIYRLLFLTARPGNVSPLHHQAIKGRQVVVTERPDLHLVWYYDRIFVKPVPRYLLSVWFWEAFTGPAAVAFAGKTEEERELWGVFGDGSGERDMNLPRAEATGLLRSYAKLIQHESDLAIALSLNLLPAGITWSSWCRFISPFANLGGREVSERYHYGEIRLTRLNALYSLLLLEGGEPYIEMHHSYATMLARFGAPYLFVFGAVTVLLTGIQTGLDLLSLSEGGGGGGGYGSDGDKRLHEAYLRLATGFVPFALLLTLAGLMLLPLQLFVFQLMELVNFFRRYQPLS